MQSGFCAICVDRYLHICTSRFPKTSNEGVAIPVHALFLEAPNRTDWVKKHSYVNMS